MVLVEFLFTGDWIFVLGLTNVVNRTPDPLDGYSLLSSLLERL